MIYYVIMLTLALLLWPTQYADERFIIPLLPFAALGAVVLIQRARQTRVRAGVVLTIAALLLVSASVKYKQRAKDWAGNLEWYKFVQGTAQLVPDSAVVISSKPSLYYQLTGRRSYRYPYTTDSMEIEQSLAGANYLLMDGLGRPEYIIKHVNGWDILAEVPGTFYLLRRP